MAASQPTSDRPQWTSRRAFVLASVAGAVGLGNLWRFPYMAGEGGGGSFIAAYAICILAVGLPLFILETSAGSLIQQGPVGLFRHISARCGARYGARYGAWFGWLIVAVALVVMSYYFVITGWTLGYFIDAVRADLLPFGEFTSGYASLWYFFAAAVLVYVVLRRGVASVERLSTFLMPLLIVMVAALAIYGQTLSGGGDALAFYASFDLDRFLSPRNWQLAAGQAFYSLGVGTSVLITYGSYVPRDVNIVTSSAAVAVTNSAVSLLSGLAVFAIVFSFGIAPDTGSQLSFTAFPELFRSIAGGWPLGALFFGLLFTAAFSSCYSVLLAAMEPLRAQRKLSAPRAALVVVLATTLLGVPSALSFTPLDLSIGGKPVLDWIDQVTGSGVVVVLGITGAALIAWRLPRAKLVAEMTAGVWRVGPLRLSPYGLIEVGRYMPLAALIILIVSALL